MSAIVSPLHHSLAMLYLFLMIMRKMLSCERSHNSLISFGVEGICRRKVESCKDSHLIGTLSDVQFCALIVTVVILFGFRDSLQLEYFCYALISSE